MKKLLLGFLLFTFLISCGNKKAKMDPFATITENGGFGPVTRPIRCWKQK